MYRDPWLADEAHRTGLQKINPAIKTHEDAEELRKALADGRIDTIAPTMPRTCSKRKKEEP